MSVPADKLMELMRGPRSAGTPAPMPQAPAAPMTDAETPPIAAPMSTPEPKMGSREAALINIGMAMDLIEQSLPALGSESEEGKAVLNAIRAMTSIIGKKQMKTLESLIREVLLRKTETGQYTTLENAIRKVVEQQDTKRPVRIERDPNDQLVVGAYRTQHFEMSPEAQKLFTSLPRTADLNTAEKIVVLHDQLFALKKLLMMQGGASEDDKIQCQQIVDKIMFLAKKMKLQDKLQYLDKELKQINSLDPIKDPSVTIPKERTAEIEDKDIDNSKLPISHAMKMQRKLKIIDND